MNKYISLGLIAGLFAISFNAAALLIIDDATDTYSQPGNDTGDFSTIAAYQAPSSPGQVFTVLSLQVSPNESGSNSSSMGSLVDTLTNSGLSSPITSLVFGFGMNEPGNANSVLTITDLILTFARPSSPDAIFSLGAEDIQVDPFNNSGASSSEALFKVDLGFDFLAEYTSLSAETFTIAATIADTSAGAEVFFLDGGLTRDANNPVPIPAAVWLFGSALVGLAGIKRRTKA